MIVEVSMDIMEVLKAIFLGIVEGITEWLPISSTGHMILVDEFIKLDVSPSFKEMFFVVIQLGAILAVLVVFFEKLNPFSKKKSSSEKKDALELWKKVIVAALPAAIIGFIFDDWMDKVFYNEDTVAITLIVYGVLFILIEKMKKKIKTKDIKEMDYKTAIKIGLFQILSLIPGTSRSGSTILGGMVVGASRSVATEFTFFLAIPIMVGASILKLVKFGFFYTNFELFILFVGVLVAYYVSIFVIRFLVNYIKKHDFTVFGWYRIILGILVILFFSLT